MELSPEFRERFVKTLQGKDYILYGGLLELARQDGLKSINTQPIQLPSAANGHYAAVLAFVETSRGVFSGLGDATPENVNARIAPHLLRMAETRAKARAMRDAVGIDMVALEELGGPEDAIPEEDKPETEPTANTPQEVKQIHRPNPEGVVVTFGKYNGKTLGEIKQSDPTYIRWLAENAKAEAVRSAARVLMS